MLGSFIRHLSLGTYLICAVFAFVPSVASAEEPTSTQTATAPTAPANATAKNTVTHHTRRSNDIRLHYVTAGPRKGKAIVLLHGWPQTWYEWHKVIPKLTASGYRAIAPDMRGFGESDKPQSGYDAANVAEDIHQLVKRLGYEQIHLIGHDIGMMVAYAYASQWPDQVSKLVVMEAALPGLGLEANFMDTAEPRGSWHFAFHIEPNLPEALIDGREAMYLSHFFKKYAFDPTTISEEDIDYYARKYAAPGATRGGFMHYRAFPKTAEQNKRFAKTKLPMSVLAIGGKHSTGRGTFKQMQPLAENLQGTVMEKSGHWIPEERPGQLATRLLKFFKEQ